MNGAAALAFPGRGLKLGFDGAEQIDDVDAAALAFPGRGLKREGGLIAAGEGGTVPQRSPHRAAKQYQPQSK